MTLSNTVLTFEHHLDEESVDVPGLFETFLTSNNQILDGEFVHEVSGCPPPSHWSSFLYRFGLGGG
jgi:hypothetical protein